MLNALRGFRVADCFWIPSSMRLPPHWSMRMQGRAAPRGLCEGGSVRHACGGLRSLCKQRWTTNWTLIEMAQSVDLSPAHFSRMFRKSTGETPHQFVLRQRIERGKEMLHEAEMRVLDVAVACGFKTQQHFARAFRRICGASPTEYRYETLS